MKFSGRLADFSLPDLLRILIQSQKAGCLVVHHEGSDSRIYIDQGALIHAESQGFSGEKAVYHMLSLEPTAAFDFLEEQAPTTQTIASDLDTLIQDGISYLDSWRKLSRRYPRLTAQARISAAGSLDKDVSEEAAQVFQQLQPDMHLHQLLEQLPLEPLQVAEILTELEASGKVTISEETRTELRRFFLETANTLLSEFDSISGLKLKQEMNERLEKLIQENNWNMEIQNGIIVDDKMHSLSLLDQKERYRLCLEHLISIVVPIYGKTFLQQVMNKVEQRLPGAVQHWVGELKLEL